ncbi:MAG: hypothetical protein ACI4GA_05820 [Acutalibacteraceae bacterium]|nr:hypothetical protein [Oscillospiraceae bacterium]
MSLGLFIIFAVVFGSLIAWGLKNEDRLIDLEDKIIEDIRDSRAQAKREKHIHVVERRNLSDSARKVKARCEKTEYVA